MRAVFIATVAVAVTAVAQAPPDLVGLFATYTKIVNACDVAALRAMISHDVERYAQTKKYFDHIRATGTPSSQPYVNH